ncbi:hypothetical protein EK904_002532 [Melospiza melodia maxima]|nr:hypothetical protein EK904_002532 [Melospiza melodia maxima]
MRGCFDSAGLCPEPDFRKRAGLRSHGRGVEGDSSVALQAQEEIIEMKDVFSVKLKRRRFAGQQKGLQQYQLVDFN